jgi:carboxynorspermidine decarboxylase
MCNICAMHIFDPHAVTTPAFVFDQSRLLEMARLLAHLRASSGCKVLYSIKALPLLPLLELLRPHLDGFSVSSLFEARLAALTQAPALHITTPGLRHEEMAELGGLCDHINFNSLEQFQRLAGLAGADAALGLRINPGLSFLDDDRYNPCRSYSRLGAPMAQLAEAWRQPAIREKLSGLHFHTLFSSKKFAPLAATVEHIGQTLGDDVLASLDWINLGGGYLFDTTEEMDDLGRIVRDIRTRWGLEVFFEPGKAVAGYAGYWVGSILDMFVRDGKMIAVLDTTVNHHPEVFEYQKRPEPAWNEPEDGCPVLLTGSSCLAGDILGEYRFASSPQLGQRVVFRNVGAYSLIKANRFNGYNLPSIYLWDGADGIRQIKSYTWEDYARQWQADPC